ncbi:MFS transporter [Coralliovum pocilloporae]|uniref:MFS transporter n=1 Tax=Coralliovum pocilloporae TaxID=3066369 RepID=UPI003307521D
MTSTVDTEPFVDDGLARRNAIVLAATQSVAGAVAPMSFAIGSIIGSHLLGEDQSLATLPITAFVVGTALMTMPAALMMRHIGRQAGFVLGAGMTIIGALSAFGALYVSSFMLFCLAYLVSGASTAFVQQYRFAAADTASDAMKPKVISWVLIGGILAAVVGPQTVILASDLIPTVAFAGMFLVQAFYGLVAIALLLFLKAPPVRDAAYSHQGRPLAEIARQPRFLIAVLCGVSSYVIMNFVMTAAPLAMVQCGHGQGDAALGIQWHVIAMFGPSFFTGHLIARFGKTVIIGVGFVLLAISAAIGLSGLGLAHFWISLVFLGVGWNFSFIGATSMLTDVYRPEERNKVQGLNEFLVFGTVGVGSFLSGRMLNTAGWDGVNMVVFPIVVLCLAALLWQKLRAPDHATA